MSKRIIILILMFIIAILSYYFYTKVYARNKTESVEAIVLNSLNDQRYISVDELASTVISGDPSFKLIDLRAPEEFKKYSIPGSANIPFYSILDDENMKYFTNDAYKMIFISNGTLQSDQAWMLLRRHGFKNLKVLKGGLNEFFKVLINPSKPKDLDPSEAFDIYSFRKAAGVYFGLPNPKDFIPENTGTLISDDINPNPGVSKKNVIQKKISKPAPKKVESPKAVIEDEGC